MPTCVYKPGAVAFNQYGTGISPVVVVLKAYIIMIMGSGSLARVQNPAMFETKDMKNRAVSFG